MIQKFADVSPTQTFLKKNYFSFIFDRPIELTHFIANLRFSLQKFVGIVFMIMILYDDNLK